MPKTEMFYGFAKKMWHCGAGVSVFSILALVASYFPFEYLFSTRMGMHALPDKRIPIQEIWYWQLYVLHATCFVCMVGAIFAVTGGVLALMYGLGLKVLARS